MTIFKLFLLSDGTDAEYFLNDFTYDGGSVTF